MKRRISAFAIVVIFIISMLNASVYANFQIPVDRVIINEVYYVEGQNVVTGESIIKPTMTMSWVNPTAWDGDPAQVTVHDPSYYDIVVNNLTTGADKTIRINGGSTEFTEQMVRIHEEMNLDTGSLYNIAVRPFHYHVNEAGTAYVLAPESGIPEDAYAITDLNVDFVSTEESITVIWDDVGVDSFEYRIIYAIGDYSSRPVQELINNKEGAITALKSTSTGVSSFYDPVENRNKLSYTITQNIYPGQVYSVMVEPTVETYNAESVMRNRNYPYIRTTSTNVELSINEEGDYVRLEWQVPGSFKVGQARDEYALVQATLLQYVDGQSSNIVIFNGDSAVIGYYKVPKPNQEVQYQIKFVYRAVDEQSKPPIEPESNLVTYVPSDIMITPTSPQIPKFFSQSILDDLIATYPVTTIRQKLADEYLVPGDTYTESLNSLLSKNITYHIIEAQSGINLAWGAFQRIDVEPDSSTYGEYIYDSNVYYDIWVTESLDALNYAIPVVDEKRYGASTPNNIITEEGETIGYSQILTSYYNEASGTLQPLVPNQVYYIKIVAKKINANQTLISEPNTVTLYYGYDGDAFEPPTIAKPPLAVLDELTTETGVTISWKENWYEVISPDAAVGSTLAVWRHQVWVQDDGTITDYYVSGSEYFPVYEGTSEAERLEDYLTSIGHPMTILSREVDLGVDDYGQSDVRYYFSKIPYAQVQDAIEAGGAGYSFNNYYQDLIEADKNGSSPIEWQEINPQAGTELDTLNYRENGLLPNTSYLFMLYPYRLLYTGEELLAHYPTPIVVSTEPEPVVVIPDPIVPNLYVSNSTDTSISVMWQYNEDFSYELMYSANENIESAKVVEWSLPASVLDPGYPVSGEYYEVSINDLFPNTDYYFWIRAYQPVTSVYSHWSNAALGHTRDVSTPNPPKGLGIASEENMIAHGYTTPIGDDYFTIEWILDVEDQRLMDLEDTNNSKVNKVYSYVVEISDNERFIDPIYVESTGGVADVVPADIEVLAKNLIKVNNLIQNRAYYVRVKTRVTITGAEQGQLIVKDSLGYTPVMKIFTVPTNDEYDGIYDPALEILPEDDYELIYNEDSDTLVYRFRDNTADDNNVDQRLITSLIEQNIYTYEIDMSSYSNKPITERIIQIPYSIMNAFNSYKVGLLIDAGDMIIELPYAAIKSELENQARQYGVTPMVEIVIRTVPAAEVTVPTSGLTSVASQQDMSINVKSTKTNTSLNYSDKNMTLNLRTNSRYDLYNQVSKVYVKDYKNSWLQVDGVFDKYNSLMVFETARIGTYSAYIVAGNEVNVVPVSTQTHWSEPYRKAVFSQYNIDNLNPYDPSKYVSETAMIQIVYGIVMNQTDIDILSYVTNGTMSILQQANIKTNASKTKTTITREEAISMMVRAYEIKNDEVVSYTQANVNALINKGVSSTYAINLAKGITLGFISDANNVRAKTSITYAELFKVWALADHLM